MIKFIEIEERLKEYFNIKKDGEVAEKLGVTSSRYGNWKKRNTIPYEEIITLCEKENINMTEIITGKKESICINYEEENNKMIKNLSTLEHEKLYHLLKSKIIEN